MPDTSKYWYSLVAASPNPETEEAANVAVVVGNGLAFHLVFNPEMPRLCGLANTADTAVYRTILEAIADRVNRGVSAEELQASLGPQLRLMRPRALYREPNDDVLARLRKQYLERPRGESDEAAARALARRSTRILTTAIEHLIPASIEIAERVTPKKLYGHKMDAHLPFRVPSVAKAVRFSKVDVLIDSVIIERDAPLRALTSTASRISLAFFGYNQLRPAIKSYADREVRLIGVIHRSPEEDPTTRQRREWVKHTWQPDSEVIDGNEVDVTEALQSRLASTRDR